ncbi:MAG: fibronectin type III domain-containing protein [Thermoplasmatota archaeon]
MKRGASIVCTVLLLISSLFIPNSTRGETHINEFQLQLEEDFTGERIPEGWSTGGPGILGMDGDSSVMVKHFLDKGITDDWHGPWLRTSLPASMNFSIELLMNCFAEGVTIARADMRVLDHAGNQLLSLSWRDVSISDGRSSVTLYGIDDSDVLFSTKADFEYSVFKDVPMELTQNMETLSLEIGGETKYTGESRSAVMNHIEFSFLKYRKNCIPASIAFDRISVNSVPAEVPCAPLLEISSSEVEGPLLDWLDVADNGGAPVISFNIYRGGNGEDLKYLTTVGSVGNFTDRTAGRRVGYLYQVTAVNPAGEGPRSNIATGMFTDTPGPVRYLTVRENPGGVQLTWQEPEYSGSEGGINYSIFRSVNGQEWTELADVEGKYEYLDEDVEIGNSYRYRISASNEFGAGELSYSLLMELGEEPGPPGPPRNLRFTATVDSYLIEWDPPENNWGMEVMGYRLTREAPHDEENGIEIVLDDVHSYADRNATAGERYYYQVACFNDFGEGQISDRLLAAPDRPSQPILPNASGKFGCILLTWQPPQNNGGSGILGYNIYRGAEPDSLELLRATGNSVEFTDTEFLYGTQYFYAVEAQNAAGPGTASDLVSVILNRTGENGNYGDVDDDAFNLTSSMAYLIAFVMGAALFFILVFRPGKGKRPGHVDDGSKDPGN